MMSRLYLEVLVQFVGRRVMLVVLGLPPVHAEALYQCDTTKFGCALRVLVMKGSRVGCQAAGGTGR